MKYLSILLFIMLSFNSCSHREDILFSASDEIHYIKLFDKNNDFELCNNGFNAAIGIYEYINDTIHLTYTENKILTIHQNGKEYSSTENEFLTRKLIIDTLTNRIYSADENSFCAFIRINKLKDK